MVSSGWVKLENAKRKLDEQPWVLIDRMCWCDADVASCALQGLSVKGLMTWKGKCNIKCITLAHHLALIECWLFECWLAAVWSDQHAMTVLCFAQACEMEFSDVLNMALCSSLLT
jgi:hypothetical protein